MKNCAWPGGLAILVLFTSLIFPFSSHPVLATETQEVEEALLYPKPTYVLYMEVEGYHTLENLLKKTSLYDLIQDEEMEDFVGTIKEKYELKNAKLEELFSLTEELGISPSAQGDFFLQTLSHSIGRKFEKIPYERSSHYMFLPDLPDGPPVDDLKQAIPVYLGIIEYSKDSMTAAKETIKEALKIIARMEELEVTISDKTAPLWDGKETFHLLRVKVKDDLKVNAKFFWRGSHLYLAAGVNQEPDIAIQSLQETKDPFIDKMRSKVQGEIPLGFCFLKAGPILDFANKALDKEKRDWANKLVEISGCSSMDTMLYGCAIQEKGFQETMFLGFPDKPEGLFGLLASQKPYEPFSIPMEKEALLLMQGSLDPLRLESLISKVAGYYSTMKVEEGWEEFAKEEKEKRKKIMEKVGQALSCLDGRLCFSLYSPALGSMIPRIALCLGLSDMDKFTALRMELQQKAKGIFFSEQEYKDVPFTTITIENNPMLSPAFALIGNEIVLAESAPSIKAFIKDFQSQEKTAPSPSPEKSGGDQLPTWKIEYDVGKLFELFYDKYFPIFNMTILRGLEMQASVSDVRTDPLVDPSLLPLSDTFLKYLDKGAGSVYRTEDGIIICTSSSLGNPIAALFGPAMAYSSGLGSGMGLDVTRGQLELDVVKGQMKSIKAALDTYKSAFGGGTSYPATLGALMEKGLVENTKIFLVPSDTMPKGIEYENEDGEMETFPCSFDYFPEKKLLFEGKAVLLYESMDYYHPKRLVLFHDGEIKEYNKEKFEALKKQ